jgi:YHS domain-containing protein
MKSTRIIAALALTLVAIPMARAQDAKAKPAGTPVTAAAVTPAPNAAIIFKQTASYPLTTCAACGKALPATPIDYVKDNHLYRLDVAACQKAVDADPAGVWKKVETAVIAQQKPTYPLKVSAVSDKALEATAVDHVYGTRLVRLASAEEVAAFEKDPAPAMAKVDKALIEAQLAGYAMKNCPVSKEELGKDGPAVDYLYGTKLVRFCCKDCIASFEKDPSKYTRTLAAK